VASTTPEKPPATAEKPPQRREPGSGIIVARPFGIPVYVSPYWFVIAGIFILVYANDLAATLHGSTRFIVAAAFVVLLYVSVLIHELSHSLVARGFGLPVRRILLYPLGGFSEIEREPQSPGREFLVSAAGPALSLALAAACYGLMEVVPPATVAGTLVSQLRWANLVVGIFNLLPGLPLDGGRMLRAVIWKLTGRPSTSTIVAAWAGRVIAVSLFAVPFVTGAVNGTGGDMVTVLWLAVIAIFMWTGAGQAIKATRFRERLPALQARRLARKAVSVVADTPLAEAIRRADENQARAVVIVDHDDKPIAIVNETAVMATPPARRPWLEAGAMARTIEPNMVLPADLSGMALLDAIRRAPATEYLLVEPSGQVYGVLATRDVDHAFAGVLPPAPLRLPDDQTAAGAADAGRAGPADRPEGAHPPDHLAGGRVVPYPPGHAQPRRHHRRPGRERDQVAGRHPLRGVPPAAGRLHASGQAWRGGGLPQGRGADRGVRRRVPRRAGGRGRGRLGRAELLAAAGGGGAGNPGLVRAQAGFRRDRPAQRGAVLRRPAAVLAAGDR
jgi:Zn-dependent protease/CBS domain-containing protein